MSSSLAFLLSPGLVAVAFVSLPRIMFAIWLLKQPRCTSFSSSPTQMRNIESIRDIEARSVR